MKAKYKANKLCMTFLMETDIPSKAIAKQCALICVDEMLEFAYDVEWEKREEAVSKLKFLKEVKQEIEKL